MACEDDKRSNPKVEPEKQVSKESVEGVSADIFSRGASEEQLQALRQAADAHKAAQAQVTEALGVLWNSQLDVVMTVGDLDQLTAVFSQRLKFFDDCSCGPCDLRPGPLCW